jgi:hypothetical protein
LGTGGIVLGLLAGPLPAHRQTFPGPNGLLVFGFGATLVTVNPDGSNRRTIVPSLAAASVSSAPPLRTRRRPATSTRVEPSSGQARTQAGLTTLRLSGPLACPKRKPSASAQPKRTRSLWGDGTGSFATNGRYAAATVRGTIWFTQDRCDGTLIRVRVGRVEVLDRVRNRRVILGAGQSYLARARR